jgi:outer membrane biosynthesis protein TonB
MATTTTTELAPAAPEQPAPPPEKKPAAKKAAAKKPAAKSKPAAKPKPAKPAGKKVPVKAAKTKPSPKVVPKPALKDSASKAVAASQPKAKLKLVRDSFTMPKADFDLIEVLKKRALNSKRPAKKSELLRAGLHALLALSDAQLVAGLGQLSELKPGRPKKTA